MRYCSFRKGVAITGARGLRAVSDSPPVGPRTDVSGVEDRNFLLCHFGFCTASQASESASNNSANGMLILAI